MRKTFIADLNPILGKNPYHCIHSKKKKCDPRKCDCVKKLEKLENYGWMYIIECDKQLELF